MDPSLEALERAKRESTLQLLFKAARLLNDEALARVRARTGADVRAAHTALFPHIDWEGTRITDIAARAGITKQGVGQLVDDLERAGLLERVPDPADGRAKLVRFTATGRRALLDGIAVLREVEADHAAALGADRMHALRETLADLVAQAERRGR